MEDNMNPYATLKGITSACLFAGVAFAAGSAIAANALKDEIVGTWQMVSNVTTKSDGSKIDTWGPNPKGMIVFERNGRVASITTRPGIPNFASNNRGTGTADENKAVVQGSIAYYGTYSVNESDKSVTYQIEAATYPNWQGTTQKRAIAFSGNEFTQTLAAGSAGGAIEIKYKRVK
jgi:hypothetical protein